MLFSFLYSLFSQSSFLKEKFTTITKVTIFLLSATSFSVFYKQPKTQRQGSRNLMETTYVMNEKKVIKL